MSEISFANLEDVASHLRNTLNDKKYILLFAYNGTGKTRLSVSFKEAGKTVGTRDTLYFNAFTEDLFHWDNDLENDTKRVLKLNQNSRFFDGLQELEMESRIGILLQRYVDFNFLIDYQTRETIFFRERDTENEPIAIKVSRGEENMFVWCFFLAVAQLAIDGQEVYSWVKYIYIDDPVSSLDDNNVIAIAHHLAQMLKKDTNSKIKTVVSSHHTLFFNVMCNEWGNATKYFLSAGEQAAYSLRSMYGDTARFYHVAMLRELRKAVDTGSLYTYHFNILRNLLEKTATFHGYPDFDHFIKVEGDDDDKTLFKRLVGVLNHGGYSLLEPVEMLPENKAHFRKILNDFMNSHQFNPAIFAA